VDKLALGQVYLQVSQFFPFSIIPLWLFIGNNIWRMNNKSVGGCSSEMLSHPIDMNNKDSLEISSVNLTVAK
jgi:hypothetical protein